MINAESLGHLSTYGKDLFLRETLLVIIISESADSLCRDDMDMRISLYIQNPFKLQTVAVPGYPRLFSDVKSSYKSLEKTPHYSHTENSQTAILSI